MFLRCAQSVRADRWSSGFEFSLGFRIESLGGAAEAMLLPLLDGRGRLFPRAIELHARGQNPP